MKKTTQKPQNGYAFCLVLTTVIWSGPVTGYETYHDPNTQGQGYCATCHGGFVGGRDSPLHALHTEGDDAMTGNCSLCHTGSGRDNPLIMWSQGNLQSCMGCHGRDYGETIEANYRGLATMDLHKNSGYGLRRLHANVGISSCRTCHTNDMNVVPYPENVVDTGRGFTTHFYTRADVTLRGLPINSCNNEDTMDDADSKGLDNDGDGLYDAEDPDCTGAPVTLSLLPSTTNTWVCFWPATFDGWRLQAASTLGGAPWVDLANVPRETTNAFWQVVLPAASSSQFLRLVK